MRFEWDAEKASINQKKHGVTFEEAQTVFGDYDALRIFDPDHSEDEDRFILLDSGCFWLSETPDKPSVGWDAKYPRICSWAQLQDRNTGNTLYFLNTHFEVDRVAYNVHFYRIEVVEQITVVVV